MAAPGFSVVIAAHNEAAVIGRCLDALLSSAEPGEIEVIVAANGCTDETAAVSASRVGVRVVELTEAGKSLALNAADAVATRFPRIYLDADIVLRTEELRRLAAAVSTGDADGRPLAAAPRRELDVSGRPLAVRAYYAINSRLPAYRDALFGRGALVLSATGRARFGDFPDLIADDLFLDGLFAPHEKRQIDTVTSRVATPLHARDLVRRLARVRAGNAALRAAAADGRAPAGVRASSRSSWLRDVVLPRPWLAPAALGYVALTLAAARQARRSRAGTLSWGQDESSRERATS